MVEENSIKVDLIFAKPTKNYVVYESAEMDFRVSGLKARIWIPQSEIQTNIPGVFPERISIQVRGDTGPAQEPVREEW